MQHRYSLLDNLVRVILYLLRCDLTDIYIYAKNYHKCNICCKYVD